MTRRIGPRFAASRDRLGNPVRIIVAAMACVAVGCTVKVDPGGPNAPVLRTDRPGALPTGGFAAAPQSNTVPPPPGLAQPSNGGAGAASSGRPASGPYRGIALSLNDPGGSCPGRFDVTDWIVSGDQVTFGSFSGVIQPDGSLKMQAGPTFVYGTYVGSHFTGRVWRPQPSCTYSLALDPAAE